MKRTVGSLKLNNAIAIEIEKKKKKKKSGVGKGGRKEMVHFKYKSGETKIL